MTSAKLIIRSPGQPDQEVRLAVGASIGRAFDNSVRVDVEGVSRYHAIIEQRADGFWLSDLGSRNGTTVNGVAVAGDRKLNGGESLKLGGMATLQFCLESSEAGANGSQGAGTSDAAKPATDSSAPDSNRRPFSAGKGALLAGLGILAVVLVVFVVAHLASSKSQVDSSKKEVTAKADGGLAHPETVNVEKSGGGTAVNANEAVIAGATRATVPVGESVERDAGADNVGPLDLRITQECQKLAGLIVNKNGSGYVFDPGFVADVRKHIDEYRIDMRDQVRTHRFQINKAFGATPLHKVTGYMLAISRSKFRDDQGDSSGIGLWRVPRSIALNYKTPEEPEAIINQPDRSIDIAAQYFKSLLNVFGPDDFMYAIACFGMPISAAGEMRNELDKAGPINRRDFWGMAKKGVVSRDGADRVVRFFAAGIAAENPVGADSQPLSWLISN